MTFDFTAFLALAIGALITLLDGAARYNTRDRLAASDGVDIPPRYFTSERGYVASVLLYLAVMEAIYLAAAIGVPTALRDGGPAQAWLDQTPLSEHAVAQVLALAGPVTFPIVWSLLLVGALRYLPWINMIEPAIRRLCHNIAEIPHYVHELSRTLYAVDVNVEVAFPQGYRDDLLLVAPSDFNAPVATEEHAWARLSLLNRELEEVYTELGNLPAVHFGARFAEEYENAASEFRSLTYRMARHVDARTGAGGARSSTLGPDHRFKADLRRAFSRVSLLYVVLLNLKYRSEDQITTRLKKLGFDVAADTKRTEIGPDAAVTVLALAIVLFVICPVAIAGVDLALQQLIGTGFAAKGVAPFPDVIVYPATILRVENADLATRVLIMFVMSFVNLLVLALVNLTIARRLAGIDPQEMFEGQWIRRPYGKYFHASIVSAVICLLTGAALMAALMQAGMGDQLPGELNPALMLIWLAPMVLIAMSLHIFAHSRGHSFGQVMGEGVICGLVWAVVTYVASFFFFTAMQDVGGKAITPQEAFGAAVYFSAISFFIGTPFTAALLFVSKSARAIGDRQQTTLLVVEGGKQAA